MALNRLCQLLVLSTTQQALHYIYQLEASHLFSEYEIEYFFS